MKMLILACALFFPSLTAQAVPTYPVGSSQLNDPKSQDSSETFTYSALPSGMMHFTDGSGESLDFAFDGKDYRSAPNRTISWSLTSESTWNTVTKVDGVTVTESRVRLSFDGKTLFVSRSGTRPDGSPYKEEVQFARVTGTVGPIGKWRSTKVEAATVNR